MRKAKVGDLVEVSWVDAVGFVNDTYDKVKVTEVKNIGWLMRMDDKEIVLKSGCYSDGTGDFTAIPVSWSDKVRVIER